MEGRCEGVETSPSPFSSAASPPCEVGGQSRVFKSNQLNQSMSQLGE